MVSTTGGKTSDSQLTVKTIAIAGLIVAAARGTRALSAPAMAKGGWLKLPQVESSSVSEHLTHRKMPPASVTMLPGSITENSPDSTFPTKPRPHLDAVSPGARVVIGAYLATVAGG